jgi:hypothetical protein
MVVNPLAGAPTVLLQPVGESGTEAWLSVASSGAWPLVYQWLFNGESLAGATNATLQVAGHRTNSGMYSVIVSNASGGVVSTQASVQIRVPQMLTLEPAPGNALVLGFNDADGALMAADTVTNFGVEVSSDLKTWRPMIARPVFSGGRFFVTNDCNQPRLFYRVLEGPAASLTASPFIASAVYHLNGTMSFNFVGTAGSTNRLWRATNLEPPVDWQVVSTNTAGADGSWQFEDTNAGGYRMQFYRVSMP